MFDLDRYLARIGAERGATLAELQRAHASSITFEGLSAHVGEPVPLDPGALAAKVVDGGRGGYCFEQNLLFKAALEALGYEVQPHLARVRVGLAPGEIRGRTSPAVAESLTASGAGTPTSGSAAARRSRRSPGAPATSTTSAAGASASSRTAMSGRCRSSTAASGAISTRSARSRRR